MKKNNDKNAFNEIEKRERPSVVNGGLMRIDQSDDHDDGANVKKSVGNSQ